MLRTMEANDVEIACMDLGTSLVMVAKGAVDALRARESTRESVAAVFADAARVIAMARVSA